MHAAMPIVIKLDPPQEVVPRGGEEQAAQISGKYVPRQNQTVDPKLEKIFSVIKHQTPKK